MPFILLLLMSLQVFTVTTLNIFDWMKDALDHEHCGSLWIKPDIDGNYEHVYL